MLFFGLRWGKEAGRAAHGVSGIRSRGGASGVLPLWFRLLGCLLHDWNQMQSRGALLHRPGEGRCVFTKHYTKNTRNDVKVIAYKIHTDHGSMLLPCFPSWCFGYKDAGVYPGRGVRGGDDLWDLSKQHHLCDDQTLLRHALLQLSEQTFHLCTDVYHSGSNHLVYWRISIIIIKWTCLLFITDCVKWCWKDFNHTVKKNRQIYRTFLWMTKKTLDNYSIKDHLLYIIEMPFGVTFHIFEVWIWYLNI